MQNFDIMTFLQGFWIWAQANPVPAMVGLLIIFAAYLVTELVKPFIPSGPVGSFENERKKAALALVALLSAAIIGVGMGRIYPQLSYGFLIGMTEVVIYDCLRYTRGGAQFLNYCSWVINQLVSWAVERITGRSSQPTRD